MMSLPSTSFSVLSRRGMYSAPVGSRVNKKRGLSEKLTDSRVIAVLPDNVAAQETRFLDVVTTTFTTC